MELILHIGLAKTGSTFLQHLFGFNRQAFAGAGVHYCARDDHHSAHSAAWAAQLGRFDDVVALVAQARASGCPRAVMSSEDFGFLLFRPALALALFQALQQAGVGRIRLLIYIRRQDEMFWGLYDTVSRSLFADPVVMFYDVMRCGHYLIHETQGLAMAPYYCFSIDHNKIVGRFADEVHPQVPALAFDIRDFDSEPTFPGRSLLVELGLLDHIDAYPGEAIQNRRRPVGEVANAQADAFKRVVGDDLGERMRFLLEARALVSDNQRAEMSAALMARFHPGNALLLQRFRHPATAPAGRGPGR